MASDRTQRFHIGTAIQVVTTALGETPPEDAEKFWVSLVQSQIVSQQTKLPLTSHNSSREKRISAFYSPSNSLSDIRFGIEITKNLFHPLW